ncbi:MAG: TrmH family RNA methyltransferase [Treponema sp.]|jgi:TrmH family RNA methyltransferase|nr:TrmH family RNA methyltransferase [Treponema sp.]
MIQLYKLDKLPRAQKLRKIAKIFNMAENRLAAEKSMVLYTTAELVFFTDAAKLLAGDPLFPPQAQEVFSQAADIFEQAVERVLSDHALFRRALNNVKHLLLSETGREQADWDFTAGDGSLDSAKRKIFEGMQVYLEDIRSPFNVGAIFRTAESFGIEKIILSPFCADPRHKRAERTAMGCIDIIPWERRELFPAEDPLSENLSLPLPVFALETGGIPIDEFPFPQRGILIAGSEELGVSPHALAAADASLGRVSIPSYGAKASLNVSVAFGIASQKWAQRWAQILV